MTAFLYILGLLAAFVLIYELGKSASRWVYRIARRAAEDVIREMREDWEPH